MNASQTFVLFFLVFLGLVVVVAWLLYHLLVAWA